MCDAIGLIWIPERWAQRLRSAEANGANHLHLMTGVSYQLLNGDLKPSRMPYSRHWLKITAQRFSTPLSVRAVADAVLVVR